jgi:hypothetical protein
LLGKKNGASSDAPFKKIKKNYCIAQPKEE